MNLKTLSISIILASLPTSAVFAAALDRSGQSIQAFLQPGNYVEAGISVLDADVSGKLNSDYNPAGGLANSGKSIQGTNLSDMAESYYFPSAALKVQINDNFSIGLLYDQPYGANAKYSNNDTIQKGAVNFNKDKVGAFFHGDVNPLKLTYKLKPFL